MRFVTLDDQAAREAAGDDPAGFLAGLGGPAFIDEIQHVPALLLELKRAVDADTVPGRFLITGSADVLAHRLTTKGTELLPALLALMQWSDRWFEEPGGGLG